MTIRVKTCWRNTPQGLKLQLICGPQRFDVACVGIEEDDAGRDQWTLEVAGEPVRHFRSERAAREAARKHLRQVTP